MAPFKAVVWALIFLTKLRFPPGVSIARTFGFCQVFFTDFKRLVIFGQFKRSVNFSTYSKSKSIFDRPFGVGHFFLDPKMSVNFLTDTKRTVNFLPDPQKRSVSFLTNLKRSVNFLTDAKSQSMF